MPNWCNNVMIIRGNKKQREEFKDKYCRLVKSEWEDKDILTLDFNKVIPQPKTIEECPEKYIIHNEEEARKEFLSWDENNERRWFNWYKFNCNEWGCKWNSSACDSIETKTTLRLIFDTPWGPPYNIIGKLIQNHPELKISGRYTEEGMEIYGSYNYKNYQED